MSSVEYHSAVGGVPRVLRYTRVRDALGKALGDLQDQRETPVAIRWNGRLLYDAAAIRKVWEACRAELAAAPWAVPASLEVAMRRELLR